MKTKNVKSLKLVKASVANLGKTKTIEIKGGRTGIADCHSRRSLCVTSCYAH